VAPTAGAAPLKAATVIQPLRPLLPSVATTEAPVRGAVAYACQTSAVPVTVFALAARLQLRPPPDTEPADWTPLPGPSVETKARISSLAEVVDSSGLTRAVKVP
jgi:hypothetical protein